MLVWFQNPSVGWESGSQTTLRCLGCLTAVALAFTLPVFFLFVCLFCFVFVFPGFSLPAVAQGQYWGSSCCARIALFSSVHLQ